MTSTFPGDNQTNRDVDSDGGSMMIVMGTTRQINRNQLSLILSNYYAVLQISSPSSCCSFCHPKRTKDAGPKFGSEISSHLQLTSVTGTKQRRWPSWTGSNLRIIVLPSLTRIAQWVQGVAARIEMRPIQFQWFRRAILTSLTVVLVLILALVLVAQCFPGTWAAWWLTKRKLYT